MGYDNINKDFVLNEKLRPYPKLFQKTSNSIWGHTLAAGPILCGIALAGSIIPFFMNTTIPWLVWLSNPGVLIPLVIVSAVVWAVIYGAEIKNILLQMFWGKEFSGTNKNINVNDTYSVITKYLNIASCEENRVGIAIELVLQYYASPINIENQEEREQLLQSINEKIDTLEKYLTHKRNAENRNESEQLVLNFIKEFKNSKCTADYFTTGYYTVSVNLEPSVQQELKKLMILNKKYPIQRTKEAFNILGWLNAFLVNSVGVAISGLGFAAFISQLLFKYGILASANLNPFLAGTIVVACFGAGAIAASVLTRLRTKAVGEDMSYGFYGWLESENKLDIFTKKNTITFIAIVISLTVAIGFAGFNYYTGYYFGSMIVELCFGNPANLINPTYILDARNSFSTLGIIFALIGFALTILSTSAFLFEVVHNSLNNVADRFNKFFNSLHKDNEWVFKFGAYLLITADITSLGLIVYSTTYAASNIMLGTTLAISTICLSLSLILSINYPEESKNNITRFFSHGSVTTIVLVMAFASAAVAAIGTAKVGSFWYTFLPSFLATTPLLQTYGLIVFVASMVAFPAVFGSAFADINTKVKEWINPTSEPVIFNDTEYSKEPSEKIAENSKETNLSEVSLESNDDNQQIDFITDMSRRELSLK